jgi:hypothetical protein
MAASFLTEIEVGNPTDQPRIFTIEAGGMLSPKDLRGKVQNLVVTKNTKATVPPRGKVIVTVPTECTDPSYPPPRRRAMDVTVFGQKQSQADPFPGRRM